MKLHLPLALYRALLSVVATSASFLFSPANADTVVLTTDQEILGDQTDDGNIFVLSAKLTVERNQTAGMDIIIEAQSTVSVGGDQKAEKGNIKATLSKLTVAGDQEAKGLIDITSTSLRVSGEQKAQNINICASTSTITGTQTADEDISVSSNTTLTVGGDQTASTGSITFSNDSNITVAGSQSAGETISVSDSTLKVSGKQEAINIVLDSSDVTVGDADANKISNQIAEESITMEFSNLNVTGNQTAGTDIRINDCKGNYGSVTVNGNQTAQDGDIEIAYSTVSVGGDQTAGDNINIETSNVTVGNADADIFSNQIAEEGSITVEDSTLNIAGNQTAGADISITDSNGGKEVSVGGDQTAGEDIIVNGSKLSIGENQTAMTGDINLTQKSDVTVGDDQTAQGSIIVTGSKLTVKEDQEAVTGDISVTNSTLTVNGDQKATAGSITLSTGSVAVVAKQSAGKNISVKGSSLTAYSQTAGKSISITDASGEHTGVTVLGNQEAVESISVDNSTVTVGGSMSVADEGTIRITNGSDVTINNNLIAQKGSLIIEGVGNTVDINLDNTGAEGSSISNLISSVKVGQGSLLKTGYVYLSDTNLTVNGTLEARSWISLGTNSVIGQGSNQNAKIRATKSLYFIGTNTMENAHIVSENGTIGFERSNKITNSKVETLGNHDIYIFTFDDETTTISDSDILSNRAIWISGIDGTHQALVSGDTLIQSSGTETTSDLGIYLSNVKLENMTREKDIVAKEGNVELSGTIDITNATITVNSGTIELSGDTTLNMHEKAVLEGTLSEAVGSNKIVKDGGDALNLNYSARNYNGKIDLTAGDGSELVINCDGVGTGTKITLKDAKLTVTQDAVNNSADGIVQLGAVDTTADTVGTTISLKAGENGHTMQGGNWSLNSHTVLEMQQAFNSSTALLQLDTLDANNAHLSVALTGDFQEGDITAQTRIQVIHAEEVKSGFNEEALYATALDPESGTEQRLLKNLNARVETTDNGIDIVFCKNYRSASGKTANQQAVTYALVTVSDRRDHTNGALAASESRLDHLLDAFDYTGSESDALSGLQSVAGAGNTLAYHSVMDSSRHHLDTLREYIALPECPQPANAKQNGTAVMGANPQSSVWVAYTGGYNLMNGHSSCMGNYTRTYQGALLGYQQQLDCRFLVGLGIGYENSISRSDVTKFSANTYFADLYASARTGRFNHRLSIGMGIHDFDTERSVYVSAGSHTFSGFAQGGLCARSLNIGYEISTDFQLTESSSLSPFITVNYAYHSFNDLKEYGMGDAGLVTAYKDTNQLELGLGIGYTTHFTLIKNRDRASFFASVALRAELSDRTPKATSNFKGAPDARFSVNSMERNPLFLQTSVGLKVPFAEGWSAVLSGSGEFGNDRTGVNGNIGVTYSF